MAIKVNNTTVINDSRALQNVTSLDATTTNTIAAAMPSGGSTADIVASGTISNGATICLNTNGTVSAVSGSEITESVTEMTFDTTATGMFCAGIYEPNQQKVVVFHRNDVNGSPQYGLRVSVGTVSGVNITFTSPQTGPGRIEELSVCYDDYANKIIAVYRGISPYYGKCRAISLSGNTINFGSEYTINTQSTTNLSVGWDESQNKCIVDYGDSWNSTKYRVITTSPSSSSLSFGSEGTIVSVYPGGQNGRRRWSYDTTINRLIYVSQTDGSSNLEARICTISGTSASFSSAVVVTGPNRSPAQGAGTTNFGDLIWDPDNECHMLLFYGSQTGYSGTLIQPITTSSTSAFAALVDPFKISNEHDSAAARMAYDTTANALVVTGNSLDYDGIFSDVYYVKVQYDGLVWNLQAAVVINDKVMQGSSGLCFDTDEGKIVLGMCETGSPGKGKGIVLRTPYANSNLTNQNFIGFSDAAYSNGQTATIEVNGNTSDAQSGLEATKKYYVQSDGSLSVLPNFFTPEAYAGIALSSSKILIKG